MPRVSSFILIAALASLAARAAIAADPSVPSQELGTRHRFVQPASSPYPAVGCRDHRTLMFIVSEVQGDDPGTAKLLLERDCRPLVAGDDYIRCGPGGWAYPAKGERLSYASYCRVGANDLALYALDAQMQNVAESASKPR